MKMDDARFRRLHGYTKTTMVDMLREAYAAKYRRGRRAKLDAADMAFTGVSILV
jgi:hypothetical protein